MTDDPYGRYLDDFGAELGRATARRSQRRLRSPRIRLAAVRIGGLALACAMIAAVLLAPSGSRRLDAVAQARAALAPKGHVVHAVIRQSLALAKNHPPGVRVSAPPQTTERWSTTHPLRWRMAIDYSTDPRSGVVFDAHGWIVGPVQYAYANGTQSTYYQRRNMLQVVTGRRGGGAERLPSPLPGDTGDPVELIRSGLDHGTLRDRGLVNAHGQAIRRLVGVVPRGQRHGMRVEYDADPHTFAPREARLRLVGYGRRTDSVISVVRFLRYERLALTPANERLLAIQPVGHPKVTRMSVDELRAHIRRETHRANRQARRALLRRAARAGRRA